MAVRVLVLVAAVGLLATASASTGVAKTSTAASGGIPPPPCHNRVSHLRCGKGYRREWFWATFEGYQEAAWTMTGPQCGSRGSGSQTLEFSTARPVLASYTTNALRQLLYPTGLYFENRPALYSALPVSNWKVTRHAAFECANDEVQDCGTRSYQAWLEISLDPAETLGRRTRLLIKGGPDQVAGRRSSVRHDFLGCAVYPEPVCDDAGCAHRPFWREEDGNLLTDDDYYTKGVLDGAAGRGPLYALSDCHVRVIRVTQPSFTARFAQLPFGGGQVEWHATTTVRWTLTLKRIGCGKNKPVTLDPP